MRAKITTIIRYVLLISAAAVIAYTARKSNLNSLQAYQLVLLTVGAVALTLITWTRSNK